MSEYIDKFRTTHAGLVRFFALLVTVVSLCIALFLAAVSTYAVHDIAYTPALTEDSCVSYSHEVESSFVESSLSDGYYLHILTDSCMLHLGSGNDDSINEGSAFSESNSYIPFAPLNAVEVDVSNAAELAALFPGDGSDLIITLTDSFTMSDMHTIVNGRTVTIISDDAGIERVLTAANGTRHLNVALGGTLILGVEEDPSGPAADINNFVLVGGSFTGVGGSVNLAPGTVGMPNTGGTLYMYGGTIRDNEATTLGGAIHMGNNSRFEMHGGTIANNTAGQSGGGIASQGTTTQRVSFTMYGGEISYNTASGTGGGHGGGGIFLQGFRTTFTMNDGIISHNTASQGGGVRIHQTNLENSAADGRGHENTFIMNDGEITHNNAVTDPGGGMQNTGGGGIHLALGSTFEMNDGTIYHNDAATTSGGGILTAFATAAQVSNPAIPYENLAVTITMNGGEIISNFGPGTGSAHGGGGIFLQGFRTTFTMNDGIISHNEGRLGGGVRMIQSVVNSNNSFTMNGGEIYYNTATTPFSGSFHGGGGVQIGVGTTFTLNDGIISYNQAIMGGGVSTDMSTTLGSTFIMNGGEITQNTATSIHDGAIHDSAIGGGGVLILGTGSTFTMNDGEITYNNVVASGTAALSGGGGIHLRGSGTTFEMNDGIIANNSARQGGGVRLTLDSGSNNNTFIMNNGEIYRNTATFEVGSGQSQFGGGGLHMGTSTQFIMNDGAIIYNQAPNGGGIITVHSTSNGSTIEVHDGEVSHNIATSSYNHHGGGGIFLQGTGTIFDMYGGIVYGNQAQHGSGVRVGNGSNSNAIFNMYSGRIENNTAITTGTGGAGVHMGFDTTFNMYGDSIITNNRANGNGGGVGTNSDPVRGSTINITDGEISHNVSLGSAGGGGMFVQGAATVFTMSGDTITINDNSANAQGGGVHMRQGTFIMQSGTITENDSFASGIAAGGVFLYSGGTAPAARFYMEGGSVSYNNATGDGGGVVTHHGTTTPGIQFVMSGDAAIYQNKAAGSLGGGGVFLQGANTNFDMQGGTIHNNHAIHGGGVRVGGGTFEMTGGQIYENNTNTVVNGINRIGRGAGVMLIGANSNFILSGQETVAIRDNEAGTSGGGVNLDGGAQFTMNGGRIHNNISRGVGSAHGGGAVTMAHVNSLFTMNGGIIEHNTANRGGGVHVSTGTFAMTDGAIRHNAATIDGGGAWIGIGTPTSGARINMTDGSFTNNIATAGDGGAIFSSPTRSENPLPLDAYPNIISASGTFLNNVAGGGLFVPPDNHLDFSFGYLLTNYNINYRTTWLVLFDLNGGHINNDTSDITFTIPAGAGEYIGASRVPSTPERDGYTFSGWRHPDSEQYDSEGEIIELVILSPDEVANYFVDGSTQFIAQWIPDAIPAGITAGHVPAFTVLMLFLLVVRVAAYVHNSWKRKDITSRT